MDEVPVTFDLPAKRTVAVKGSKEINVITTGHEKTNFTVVLCVTSLGYKCKPMLIFKRKTIPKVNFPKSVVVCANEKGWINSEMMKVWVENVWKIRPGGFFNPKSLLALDSCPAHKNSKTMKMLKKVSDIAMIPGGLTKKLQPLDLSVNKVFKNKLRKLGENYMFESTMNNDSKIKKPSYQLVAEWVDLAWKNVSKIAVINGFKKSIGSECESDTDIDSDYDGDSESDLTNFDKNQVSEVEEMLKNFNIISDDEFDEFETEIELIN